jgi:hypothetical protein
LCKADDIEHDLEIVLCMWKKSPSLLVDKEYIL